MLNKARIRDIAISVVMAGAAIFVLMNPVEKYAAGEKIQLAKFIPDSFGGWAGKTFDTSDYSDKWQSINELLVREYFKPQGGLTGGPKRLGFILEYSSDLRRNFSLHFPEGCHRAAGNDVEFLKPFEVELAPGKTIKAKCLFIFGKEGSFDKVNKIVAYWIVIDEKQYYETFWIKVDQAVSGLLKKSKRGFLVRFDYQDALKYTPEGIAKAQEAISGFIKDLYKALDTKPRKMIFGAEVS